MSSRPKVRSLLLSHSSPDLGLAPRSSLCRMKTSSSFTMAFQPVFPLRLPSTPTPRSSAKIAPAHPSSSSFSSTFLPSRPIRFVFAPTSSRIIRTHPLPLMTAIRPILPNLDHSTSPHQNQHSQFRLSQSRSNPDVQHVATARAITPMRRPSQTNPQEPPHRYTEQPLPSQRRSDLMAPQRVGFWSLIPYVAATVVVMAGAWLAKKRFVARQKDLVDEFGEVVVLYGNTPDTKREITSEYKRKLGPGILRGAMFSSYLRNLVTEKSVVPSTIQDVSIIKALLKMSDDKAVKMINTLATTLQDAPSLLGKLLFIAERIVSPEHVQRFCLVPLFPYSESTVADLQRNMLERCYREFVNEQIDVNNLEEPPMAAAAALRLDATDAKTLFDGVVLARIRKKEKEAADLAAAEAEEASKPNVAELDYPARSGQPAKAAVHAYQCSDCGYTLFPAAGREFKFYGDDFVCPACGAPKDKFVDLNADNRDE